jgi:hypothetical protein
MSVHLHDIPPTYRNVLKIIKANQVPPINRAAMARDVAAFKYIKKQKILSPAESE